MFNCMMKWLKCMYHRHMVSYIIVFPLRWASIAFWELTRNQYILRPLWEHTHTPWKLQSWFATTTSWSTPENHWYIKVGLLVLVHADKPKQLPRAAKLYNRYMIQVPDGHHVVLLKKDATNHWTWTSRGVKYATPTDTSPDPDNRIQMHFDFHHSRRWNSRRFPAAQEGSDRRVCNSW
jgi:hypothetical protein